MPTPTASGERPGRLPRPVRREQLLDVAEELFCAVGYAATSIEDIARGAGVSRPIVYEHFGTKEGVYLACVRRAREEYERELIAAIDLDAGPREQLARGADAFFALVERNPGRWRLLFGSNAVLPGEHNDELAQLRFETISQIARVMQRAAPEAPAARIEACAHAASGVGERLGHWWLANPTMIRDEVVAHFTDILWDGLRVTAEMNPRG